MKIYDILMESPEDTVARFYKEASADSEQLYNKEAVKYKEKNNEYYDKHFESWFSEEITPVFTKPIEDTRSKYTNIPKKGKLQSPGYRGLHHALQAAGLPYNHNVQKYDPSAPAVMSSEMDSVRNNKM